MRVLRSRLLAAAQEEAAAAASDARRSQVRTVDRSERVRTYNFAENRISDHRVGFKAYNLDQVLDGALDDVIDALTRADVEALLGRRVVTGPARPVTAALAEPLPAPGRWRCVAPGGRRVAPRALPRRPRARGCGLWTAWQPRTKPCSGTSSRGAPPVNRCSTSSDMLPFRHLEVAVGPGVFVPRPETELLVDEVLDKLRASAEPVVVDLCAGSGAIALSIAQELAGSRVYAVKRTTPRSPGCGATPRAPRSRRLRPTSPTQHCSRTCAAASTRSSSNPPYLPASTPVEPEVHADPAVAVFAAADGMAVIAAVVARAAELLKAGGLLVIEHDETQGDAVPALLDGTVTRAMSPTATI